MIFPLGCPLEEIVALADADANVLFVSRIWPQALRSA